jgi:hypothetical protein
MTFPDLSQTSERAINASPVTSMAGLRMSEQRL